MTTENQAYFKERLGYLFELIIVKHQVNLIQALAHFWEVTTTTFLLGKNEMVPILEEYKAAIGIDFKPKIVEPPIGLNSTSISAKFLNLETTQVEKLIKTNTRRFPLSFLISKSSKSSTFPKEMGNTSARVFVVAFFGFILFLVSRTRLDPLVTIITRQTCLKWDFSNMLLAETIISLNKFQNNENRLFQAS